ncbi:MAG: DinB family protein [Saprospirales bacterium]|nr:MAG: DinB family protein [Saprospirales bacterium]
MKFLKYYFLLIRSTVPTNSFEGNHSNYFRLPFPIFYSCADIRPRVFVSILLGIALLCSFPLFSQSTLQSELHTKWLNGAEYTLEIARMMPAENYDFRPVEESMTFGEQLLHITANMDWLGKNHLSAQSHSMPLRDTIYDKEELIRILEEGFENAAKAIKGLPSEQLGDIVEFFAGPMTKRQIIHLMHDHHTHHRGQLIVYLRLNGLQPPIYRGW